MPHIPKQRLDTASSHYNAYGRLELASVLPEGVIEKVAGDAPALSMAEDSMSRGSCGCSGNRLCPYCHGTGRRMFGSCPVCGGSGVCSCARKMRKQV